MGRHDGGPSVTSSRLGTTPTRPGRPNVVNLERRAFLLPAPRHAHGPCTTCSPRYTRNILSPDYATCNVAQKAPRPLLRHASRGGRWSPRSAAAWPTCCPLSHADGRTSYRPESLRRVTAPGSGASTLGDTERHAPSPAPHRDRCPRPALACSILGCCSRLADPVCSRAGGSRRSGSRCAGWLVLHACRVESQDREEPGAHGPHDDGRRSRLRDRKAARARCSSGQRGANRSRVMGCTRRP